MHQLVFNYLRKAAIILQPTVQSLPYLLNCNRTSLLAIVVNMHWCNHKTTQYLKSGGIEGNILSVVKMQCSAISEHWCNQFNISKVLKREQWLLSNHKTQYNISRVVKLKCNHKTMQSNIYRNQYNVISQVLWNWRQYLKCGENTIQGNIWALMQS